MKRDAFFESKRFIEVGDARVAYVDQGSGPPVLLLHGCPFSSFVWRNVISRLRARFRCIAPDLRGLGDTETAFGADWSVRSQVQMVVGLLDALGLEKVHVVGHDQGGAVAQLLAANHPNRIDRLVLSNAEAYDNWPSRDELPFVRLTQVPVLGRAVLWLWSSTPAAKLLLSWGKAVRDRSVLTPEMVGGYVRANLGNAHKRAKTRRYLAAQLDPSNNQSTLDAVEGLRRFDHPTLLLWAKDDPHFGPQWAERLSRDLPRARLELLPSGHLLMEEQPEQYAQKVSDFVGPA